MNTGNKEGSLEEEEGGEEEENPYYKICSYCLKAEISLKTLQVMIFFKPAKPFEAF